MQSKRTNHGTYVLSATRAEQQPEPSEQFATRSITEPRVLSNSWGTEGEDPAEEPTENLALERSHSVRHG
jgi:hypothetical protein